MNSFTKVEGGWGGFVQTDTGVLCRAVSGCTKCTSSQTINWIDRCEMQSEFAKSQENAKSVRVAQCYLFI